MPCSSAVGYH